ncbi:MAG: hypothetical protein OES47_09190 [Acidobacteriota bacterium]|nr:hypothetical protein [Acidobacteriota bacterium]
MSEEPVVDAPSDQERAGVEGRRRGETDVAAQMHGELIAKRVGSYLSDDNDNRPEVGKIPA